MRKFSRTNPRNKSMSTLIPMRHSVDTDNDDSLSNFSIKNETSINRSDVKSSTMGMTLSSVVLGATLAKNRRRNLHYSFSILK